MKQAVSEIKKAARSEPALAAEGAVILLERLSPALEQVDSSSGAIGTAVNSAIRDLVPIIADAPADPTMRADWLDRLWAAHEADEIPYIECLTDHWGELCASKEAGPYDQVLDLAGRTPCDPKTLTRAARDHAKQHPDFAIGAGLLALHSLVQGYGYEITGADVWAAFSSTMTRSAAGRSPLPGPIRSCGAAKERGLRAMIGG
ncbi:MAG: hypothetical protein HZB25_02965 [Candidatus Eisenbacteria bacterium]|nr:hypothetical protein [Candidatus Eisenbacteria bacterium]